MTSAIPPTPILLLIFFFNDTPTTEIYTLSLHDALPISNMIHLLPPAPGWHDELRRATRAAGTFLALDETHSHVVAEDRKSTRLNSSHSQISYAVFCLKKKKKTKYNTK